MFRFCHVNERPNMLLEYYLTLTIFFYVVLGGGTLWNLQKFLQWIKYIILKFTPSTALLYYLSPSIPGIVSTGIIFAFTYMYTFKTFSLNEKEATHNLYLVKINRRM
jgi:hypothetical protein